MSRPIVLANSHMHVGLNNFGLVHDFYFPYVGLENHTAGGLLRHRIGVYVDGEFSWLDDDTWHISSDYYGEVLVSKIIAQHAGLQVRLEMDDCVDSEINAFLRNIHVINMADTPREIRLFMHQVFVISDAISSDTVQYLPHEDAILHYKGHRVFLVGGSDSAGAPFSDYTVGMFGIEGHEGTFRDAEDGNLMKNPVEHGRVDSTIGFHVSLAAHSSSRVHYWISAARSEREAKKIHHSIKELGLLHHLLKTANWWSEWSEPARKIAAKLPEEHRTSFVRSALIIKAHTDKQGAVIASTDTKMLNYERDAYAYCWPRDAAYVLWPLMRIGYTSEVLNYFSFARRSLSPEGYLHHKYQSDGAVGPSWHPYIHPNGEVAPPIQTDETALTLFLFGQYWRMHKEPELVTNFYVTMVKPMANFLTGFVDEAGLPRPSYDLWEEKFLTTTYTTAVTFAALMEAVAIARSINDVESAERWQHAAQRMYEKRDVFYNDQTNYFIKGYTRRDGEMRTDKTIDASSLFAVFMFGYFEMSDKRVTTAYATLKQTIMFENGRVIRYQDDNYRRMSGARSNTWPVTSLWFAQYAQEIGDDDHTAEVLSWVREVMYPSGVIAEQYDEKNQPQSVAPLAWSQAEYMNALLDMITET